MRFRAGLLEGPSILLGLRRPIEPTDIFDWFNKEMEPVNEAWSRIWVIGTQDAVDAGNRLVYACSDLLEAASARSPRKFVAFIVGEIWTRQQEEAYQAKLKEFSDARMDFARLMRKELGRDAVEFVLKQAEITSGPDSNGANPQAPSRQVHSLL